MTSKCVLYLKCDIIFLVLWSCAYLSSTWCHWNVFLISCVMSSSSAYLSPMCCHWDIPLSLNVMSLRCELFHYVFSLRSALDLMCDVINTCPVIPLRCALYLMCDVINRTCSSFMFSLSYDLYVVCDVIRMSCALHLTCDVTVMCLWSYLCLWCHRDAPLILHKVSSRCSQWGSTWCHRDVPFGTHWF